MACFMKAPYPGTMLLLGSGRYWGVNRKKKLTSAKNKIPVNPPALLSWRHLNLTAGTFCVYGPIYKGPLNMGWTIFILGALAISVAGDYDQQVWIVPVVAVGWWITFFHAVRRTKIRY